MEKIIYNTKLKKLLISMVLVTIIMSFFKPKAVFATTIEDRMFYEQWLALDEAKGHEDEIKRKVVDEIVALGYLGTTNAMLIDDEEKLAEELYLSKTEYVVIGAKLEKNIVRL